VTGATPRFKNAGRPTIFALTSEDADADRGIPIKKDNSSVNWRIADGRPGVGHIIIFV